MESASELREPSGRGGVVRRSGQGAGTKLPKLGLPRFSGEVTEWLTFLDSYQAGMRNNPSLLPVQKFTYLLSLVSKSAKEAIAGTDANYSEAVKLFSLVSKSAKEAIAGLALTDAINSDAVKLLEIRFGNKERMDLIHRNDSN